MPSLLGLIGGWAVSARILRPLDAIAKTASVVSATHLSERIDVQRIDGELAGLARELNAAFDRLEAAFERQTRFSADVAHELRTPLTILHSETELALARPRTPDDYRDTLDTCLRTVKRMNALVDGLLTLARAEGSQLILERRTVDLRQLVEDILVVNGPLAEQRRLSLTVHLRPVRIDGDSMQMAQDVTNLLTNAVQYKRPGSELADGLMANATEATISVSDTGYGIPEEDHPHIFERFYRADSTRRHSSGGNGLGLAICKSIVEAHGGSIGFESAVNAGSTFWVRLACTERI